MTRRTVTVRMYNTGFGDCFLVTIPARPKPIRILIDCGTHPSSTGARRAERDAVPSILGDLSSDGHDPQLDVVVATHRHKDHVSGFESPKWADVTVGEVWLPWTEDPNDKDAVRILNRQSAAAVALMAAIGLVPKRQDGAPLRGPAGVSLALAEALLKNSLTNEAAMETLHTGFKGSPLRRYLSVQDQPLEIGTSGVSIHVLAPSRDEAVIRDLDPPPGESWRQVADMAVAQGAAAAAQHVPFDEDWALSRAIFDDISEFSSLRISGQQIGAIRRALGEDLVLAAASLEKAVNGTSIMLAIEIDDLVLWFPGDAQWGSWRSVLENPAHRALIQRAKFYKIGHHGSHNATPRSYAIDVIAPDAWAALPWAKVAIWPSIPSGEMLESLLGRHVQVVRSDQFGVDIPPTVSVRGDVSADFAFALT